MAERRLTRRSWAALLAAASSARATVAAPAPAEPPAERLRRASQAVARVQLPRETPPAFRFDPR